MPGATAKHGLPYSLGTDPANTIDDTMQDLAERLDLMLGERGVVDITPSSANTDHTVRINYSRSYAALAPVVPSAFAVPKETWDVATNDVEVWCGAEDATGFTLHLRATTTNERTIAWYCRP